MGADSLYYIRDYSGNYYRINNVNELVAVRNETDATVFNYDQARSHIGTGKKSASLVLPRCLKSNIASVISIFRFYWNCTREAGCGKSV